MLMLNNKTLLALLLTLTALSARADVIMEKESESYIRDEAGEETIKDGGGSASSITITTADGRGADAYVRGGDYSDTNFGTSEQILTRYANSESSREKDYFRFDLSGLNIDPSKSAQTPVFSFTSESKIDSLGYNLYILNDGTPGDSVKGWEETSITYNNAPGNNLETNGFLTGKEGSMTLIGEYKLSGDVGDTLSLAFDNAFLLNDTNGLVTFALVRTSSGKATDIASKESKFTPPSLTVGLVSEAVPEPAEIISAVAILAAIGGLLLGKFKSARKQIVA
ncbi:MAG: DNRLRE domain-containing protein [Chthoniobacterales bacterium]